jgi:hypothetical protein
MKLNELTQPELANAAEYFGERDKKYSTSALRILAVVQEQTDDNAGTAVPTTIGELLECLNIVPRLLQIPHGTSLPRSSDGWLGPVKQQSNTSIPGLEPLQSKIRRLC